MMEVAVIGAGAAGLVTARQLLRCGLRACVFESRLGPGGAWSCTSSTTANNNNNHNPAAPQMWDTLTPNLSKYTCLFSDHPWESLTDTNSVAAFSTLGQMQNYLNDYAAQYLLSDPDHCSFHYGCTVTHVERVKPTDNVKHHQYSVEWVNHSHSEKDLTTPSSSSSFQRTFDGVVVASGFFSTPVWPTPKLQQQKRRNTMMESSHRTRIWHSSQYRNPTAFVNQTVAIVGEGFSACEIVSAVSRCAQKVVHIRGHRVEAPYVLPRYVPYKDSVLPLDVALYARRQDAPAVETTLLLDDDDDKAVSNVQKRHDMLRQLLGPRKCAQARRRGWPIPDDEAALLPPHVAISDDYLDRLIDGHWQVLPGRVVDVVEKTSGSNDNAKDTLEIVLDDGTVLAGIDHMIACTGYRSSLDFLSSEIHSVVEYNASDVFAPLTLCHETLHPQFPGLGFVGMYRGPYFGVMELQAKLYAEGMKRVSHGIGDLFSPEQMAQALATSRQIREHRPRAQFPRFDYIGFMDTLAQPLNLVPPAATYGAKGQMVTPAFYQSLDDDHGQRIAAMTQSQLEQEKLEPASSDRIPRATLSALVGRWKFEREIRDRLSSTTQHVHGTVVYSIPRQTQDNNEHCVRYREDGFLDLPNGNTLEVFREYDYLCGNDSSNLELYFIENGVRAHLFLSLKFAKHQNGYWYATSDHLCIKDLYKGTFEIAFDGLSAKDVSMTYRVVGPNKDYESITRLTPIL